eukprot:GFUD01049443.1.p1 GENE.GFUD01049443.1~~GFUD01049443.1.p1  ORF type:complete len:132 (+),score=28.66 GFUD01049443.1:56-451(+)
MHPVQTVRREPSSLSLSFSLAEIMLHLLPAIFGSVEYLLVTRGEESGGRGEVLGAGRLWSCSFNNCAALKVASGSFLVAFGVFGADPAQLAGCWTHKDEQHIYMVYCVVTMQCIKHYIVMRLWDPPLPTHG